jgi:hypothetical protein
MGTRLNADVLSDFRQTFPLGWGRAARKQQRRWRGIFGGHSMTDRIAAIGLAVAVGVAVGVTLPIWDWLWTAWVWVWT